MNLMDLLGRKHSLPAPGTALAGRREAIRTAQTHFVNRRPLSGPYPDGAQELVVGMGCFWGAERIFWQREGVWVTAAGYAGGETPNPTYEEVCSGATGHSEVVKVVYLPSHVSLQEILTMFWEGHDPTQGMRQGNDVGTQYRSVLYYPDEETLAAARASAQTYQRGLHAAGYGDIATEIAAMPPFYYAEDYHQQYLAKNPHGYCGIGGTGVSCPVGTG